MQTYLFFLKKNLIFWQWKKTFYFKWKQMEERFDERERYIKMWLSRGIRVFEKTNNKHLYIDYIGRQIYNLQTNEQLLGELYF